MNMIKPDMKYLTSDLLAGLTFALVNIPQSMAHALLASVSPVFGLYTLMLATPVGALFTSAVLMNVSTTSALAVAASDTLITFPSSVRPSVLVALVLLIGVFQIVMGLLRLGWIIRFIPFSVMTGFMNGVAVLIIIGQLGDFTGYYSPLAGKIVQLADLVIHRQSIDWATLAIGLLTVVLIYWLGSTRLSKFALVLALVLASGAAILLNQLFGQSIKLVGDIAEVPRSLPSLALPQPALILPLIIPAIAVGIIGLVRAPASARPFPTRMENILTSREIFSDRARPTWPQASFAAFLQVLPAPVCRFFWSSNLNPAICFPAVKYLADRRMGRARHWLASRTTSA